MELRQLRYFLAVCEELHFGRAALRVHISQPPLSQQILQLEEELRVKLFYRTKRRVQLTEAGRVFAGEARLILQQVEQAAELAADANRSVQNRLVVACSPPNETVVTDILKVFSERHPDVHLVVKSLVTPRQVEALRNGRIDAGFLTLPIDREGIAIETVLRERLMVVIPKGHPLSKHKRIALRALANETLIIFPLHMSPGRYELIAAMCRKAGFSLHLTHEIDNIHTMLKLVSGGFGVSLMRESARQLKLPGILFKELQHSPVVETGIAFPRRNQLKTVPLLVDVAREVVQKKRLSIA
jgi:DNA-binding transcriptional LysR family regulator